MKRKSHYYILLITSGVVLTGCTKEKEERKQESAAPVVAFGYPYPEPEKKLPSSIVLVYLDGPAIECEGKNLQLDEVEGYVKGVVGQKKSEMIFVYTTSDVVFGRVTQVLERLKRTPVRWIRIDDHNIPPGYRFPQK